MRRSAAPNFFKEDLLSFKKIDVIFFISEAGHFDLEYGTHEPGTLQF